MKQCQCKDRDPKCSLPLLSPISVFLKIRQSSKSHLGDIVSARSGFKPVEILPRVTISRRSVGYSLSAWCLVARSSNFACETGRSGHFLLPQKVNLFRRNALSIAQWLQLLAFACCDRLLAMVDFTIASEMNCFESLPELLLGHIEFLNESSIGGCIATPGTLA